MLEQRDSLVAIEELRARIDEGLASLDRGEAVDGETFMQATIDRLDSDETSRRSGSALNIRPTAKENFVTIQDYYLKEAGHSGASTSVKLSADENSQLRAQAPETGRQRQRRSAR